MRDTTMTNGLVQTWVPVADASGQTHLEAHWVDSTTTAPTHITHAA